MMLKAMAWERAKGELRACLMGAIKAEPLTGDDNKMQRDRWSKFNDRIEAFISDVEDHGLNE
jgi:hypothetical protein